MQNRIFYSDNGTLTDLSVELNRYQTGTVTIPSFVAAEDKLFIGSRHPFNHFYVKMGTTVNSNTVTMTIKHWDGTEFLSVVEVIDETNGLKNSGFVTFFPDKDERWAREDTNFNGDSVIGLTGVVIYDRYWSEITFSGDLSAGVEISWLGQKFCDDHDLGSEYPDLDRSITRDAFLADGQSSGDKTDWEEQIVKASEIIVRDLIAKEIIKHAGQILKREELSLACVSKLAEIIYNGLGDDYEDDRIRARNEYQSRMNKRIFKVDQNADAVLDVIEENIKSGFLIR